MTRFIAAQAQTLYWFGVIRIVRTLGRIGASNAAEWVGRVTGLRARLFRLLHENER